MNDKLKFYRSTLVQMTKEAYKKLPNEMKVEEAVNYGDLLTKAIMKQCDEFADECFGETSNCCDPKFYITVDPRYNVTTTEEPMRTIVDHGPQYKTERKGIYELTNQDVDFIISEFKTLNSIISNIEMPSNKYKDILRILVDVPHFIYSKACEKCEE